MNIYVSNLSFGTGETDLAKLFSSYGQVSSAKIMMDKYTNKSKGFGFVEMPDMAEGTKAIKELNGTMADGRSLRVDEAKPREENSRSGAFSKKW